MGSDFGVYIEGAGMAGQVLHRELQLRGIPSVLADRCAFPRDKVCGGVLQPDSWKYLNEIFTLKVKPVFIDSITHFWRRKRIARHFFPEPLVFVPRIDLDDDLNRVNQNTPPAEKDLSSWLTVDARGISGWVHGKNGNPWESGREGWLGFHGKAEPAEGLEMHYGDSGYLGVCPDGTGFSHAAFILKKTWFGSHNAQELTRWIHDEFGVHFLAPPKGTGMIYYGRQNGGRLAIGDTKLSTHPFLGLGMKHAIESARLLADLIEAGDPHSYERRHRRLFFKIHGVSRILASCYDSRLRLLLWPFLRSPALFIPIYRWLHTGLSPAGSKIANFSSRDGVRLKQASSQKDG